MTKKELGSYYTSQRLAAFIANYCMSRLDGDSISILEPSVGDGVFIEAVNASPYVNNFDAIQLEVVERENEELNKARQKNNDDLINLVAMNQDYLSFHKENQNTYSLIIGNPPYVKSSLLTEEQRALALEIHLEQNLSNKRINNIWTAFLVSAISKLEDDGILAFVLPLELLQVKFTFEIREFLKQTFARLEIFMFDELQFQECKGQDTVLLIAFKEHIEEGTFYTTVSTMDDLENHRFVLQQNITVSESDKKWTHHFLSPEEHNFLNRLKTQLNLISHYVENKAGIVTAANDYFIVKDEVVTKNRLRSYSKPIVQKGVFVNGSVTFEKEDFNKLVEEEMPAYLLDFNKVNPKKISKSLESYLAIGTDRELELRFKCRQREHWYQIPNISRQSEAFFFKRAHQYPKFLKNNAEVYVTDSAYMVESREGFHIENIIFSFYNSLTLAFAELEGRYYGGGVLELTPNEFRALPIPYVTVNDFNLFKNDFKEKNTIEEILAKYNGQILIDTLNLSSEETRDIELIRKKLVNKRQRK